MHRPFVGNPEGGGVCLCFWDRCLEVVWKLELEYLDNTLWDPGWEDGPY